MRRLQPPAPNAALDAKASPGPHKATAPFEVLATRGGERYELLCRSSAMTVATTGHTIIAITHVRLTMLGVDAVRRAFQRLEAKCDTIGYFALIDGRNAGSNHPVARRAMAEVVRRYTQRVDAAAFVVDGDGLKSTLVRRVVLGMHLASRASHPVRVFSTLEPALAWYGAMHEPRRRELPAVREIVTTLFEPAA